MRRSSRRHESALSPRLCEKSVVQFARRTFVSISSIPKTIALGTSVKSRQLRKQFCAPLARATFHTAWVESECGAVAVGRTYLLPPLSFGGALLVRPWLRFHIPLIA